MTIPDNLKYPPCIAIVDSLNHWQKLEIYLNYYCDSLALVHNCEVIDINEPDLKRRWNEPDKKYLGIGFSYLWKHRRESQLPTFEKFTSKNNIDVRYCGEDWKEKGFAQKWWIELFGIYREYNINNPQYQ